MAHSRIYTFKVGAVKINELGREEDLCDYEFDTAEKRQILHLYVDHVVKQCKGTLSTYDFDDAEYSAKILNLQQIFDSNQMTLTFELDRSIADGIHDPFISWLETFNETVFASPHIGDQFSLETTVISSEGHQVKQFIFPYFHSGVIKKK